MISLDSWRARGRSIPTPAGAVFAVESGAEHGGTPVLCLHGFPTASWDFAEVIEQVSRRRRVIALDFLGFGFSAKPTRHAYSLFEQGDVALAVARAFDLGRVHVMTHDMGTSVAAELCARTSRSSNRGEQGRHVTPTWKVSPAFRRFWVRRGWAGRRR